MVGIVVEAGREGTVITGEMTLLGSVVNSSERKEYDALDNQLLMTIQTSLLVDC